MQPKAEAKKVRAEKGEAYLSFVVNKSYILANFRENATELKKITSTIDLVKNDKNVEITDIDIHGLTTRTLKSQILISMVLLHLMVRMPTTSALPTSVQLPSVNM